MMRASIAESQLQRSCKNTLNAVRSYDVSGLPEGEVFEKLKDGKHAYLILDGSDSLIVNVCPAVYLGKQWYIYWGSYLKPTSVEL